MEDLLENKRRRKERPEMDKKKGKRRVSRGAFLKGAGAALVLVAGGGVWRAVDQGPAYEPWEDWREAEGPMSLVSAAILAANPHNTQPWLFEVSGGLKLPRFDGSPLLLVQRCPLARSI